MPRKKSINFADITTLNPLEFNETMWPMTDGHLACMYLIPLFLIQSEKGIGTER